MMRFLGKFATAIVLLASTGVAQVNPSQEALAHIPTCTQKCGLDVLVPAQCELADLSNCLCTNSTLQLEFSVCVVDSCGLTDQFTSLTILQNDICKDAPVPSRSAEMIRAVIIISAFTYVIIVLRFYSRALVMSKMWWDDWAIALAAILMIPMTIIPIFNATRGFGKHFWNVPPQNDAILRKLYYISQILYAVVQALAKFSILLLYLRVFPSKKFRLIVKIAIGWMICHTVALTLVVSLQCVPVKSVWDRTVDGVCIHSQAFVYSGAGISIFEDFVIMLLPIWELKDLSLNLKKKVALIFLFALGSFACITSMIRLKYIVAYGSSVDVTYDNVDVILWSVLEDYVAIICACLMCLRPLVVKFLPMIFSSPGLSESKHTQNHAWVQSRNSRLASKLGASVDRYELHSEDDETRGRPENGIMVQKAWATQTSEVLIDGVELPERSYSLESYGRSEDSRQGRRT